MSWSMGAFVVMTIVVVVAKKMRELGITTLREAMPMIGALCGLLALGYLGQSYRLASGESYFREQFNLPDGAEFVDLPLPRHGPPTRAVVGFSEAGWREFLAGMENPAQQTPFLFAFPGDPARHAAIARWRELPPPMRAENAPDHIMKIPRNYDFYWDYKVKRGRMLCIAYVAQDATGARDCADTVKGDPLYAYVLGIVDFDRREAHLRFRGVLD